METELNDRNEQGDNYLDQITMNTFPTITSYGDASIAQFVMTDYDLSSNNGLPTQILEIGQTATQENTTSTAIIDQSNATNVQSMHMHTSNVLQQIYYSTENDVLELQNLLLSWNLSELTNFFVRKFFVYLFKLFRIYTFVSFSSRSTTLCWCVETYVASNGHSNF